MKFLLIGCNGKMGKMVLKCKEKDEIIGIDRDDKIENITEKPDAIIDFSTSESRAKFIEFSKERKLPYACFSTNLSIEDVNGFKTLAKKVPVLLCSNSSKGMRLMFELVETAAKEIKTDAVLTEYHHKNKKDNPSGSARVLEGILTKEGVSFSSKGFRVGSECGTHEARFFMEDEMIEIRHVAHSRKIFAIGAIEMTKILTEKTKGLYTKL